MQAEQKMLGRPVQAIQNAIRAMRGENTAQLVEQFTEEMTLVAEGLAEDQSRLRDAVERIGVQQDRAEQRAQSELSALEQMLLEQQRETDERLDALERRLNTLEGSLREKRGKSVKQHTVMDRATVIVSIAASAWVLTAIIGLFG